MEPNTNPTPTPTPTPPALTPAPRPVAPTPAPAPVAPASSPRPVIPQPTSPAAPRPAARPAPRPAVPTPPSPTPAPRPVAPAPAPAPATPAPAPTPVAPTPEPISAAEALEKAITDVKPTSLDAPTETIAPAKKKPKTLLLLCLVLFLIAGAVIALMATGVLDFSGRKTKPEPEKIAAGPTAAKIEEVCTTRGLNYAEMLPEDELYDSYKVILGDDTESIHHCITPPETTIESGSDTSEEIVTVFFNGNFSEFDDEKNNNLVGSYRDASKNGDSNVTVLENTLEMFKVVTVSGPLYNYFIVYKNSMTFIRTGQIDSAETILNQLEYPDRSHADPEATAAKIENAKTDESIKTALQSFNINISNYIANKGALPVLEGESQLEITGTGTTALDELYSGYLANIKNKDGESYAFQASAAASEDLAMKEAITLHYNSNCAGENETLQIAEGQYALTHPSADGNKYYCVSNN